MTEVRGSLASLFEKGRKTFSVELWPPRSEAAQQKLDRALEVLENLAPDFVSITYGAGGSTRDRTHALVLQIAEMAWTIPMAHLTCAAHSVSELKEILTSYDKAGVRNILALRGDPPLDATSDLPQGELTYASQLIELAKGIAPFTVAVAAHPEGHLDSLDLRTDRIHLAEKLKLADFAITQFYFDASAYRRLVDDLDALGVDKPILPGVMAPTSWSTLRKMSELSGATIPQSLKTRFEKLGDDHLGIRALGVEIAIELAEQALDDGAPGVHVYSMNSAESTVEIFEALKHRIHPTSSIN